MRPPIWESLSIFPSCECMLTHFSRVHLFVTPWPVARQAALSMGFSRQEYWSGLPSPPAENLPDPETEPVSLTSPALAGMFFTTSATWEVPSYSAQITLIISTHLLFSPYANLLLQFTSNLVPSNQATSLSANAHGDRFKTRLTQKCVNLQFGLTYPS